MIKHYRGEEFIQKIEPVSAQLKRALMGPFLLEIEVADIENLVVGDLLKIEHLNETFTFRIREIRERQITAEHISYVLQNYAVVDKYFNNPPTYDDFIEFADVTLNDILNGFLAPLLNDAGFTVINNSNSADTKDITFQGDNLFSAIQKISDIFKVEFMQHDTYIEFVDQVGADRDLTINAGVESDKIIKKIDRSHIVTRVYPLGSSENLPEGYYYSNLKPTTFDLATKTHSGNVYVDNTEGINTYGIIEKIVEFQDIKLQSRHGTVDSAGEDYLSEYDKNYPYIYDPALSDIDEDKALSATLFIVDGLKAAELRIIKASASEKRIYYSKTLKDGSELDWVPSSGARYILVGYISQAEMDKARDELIEAAQDYLNKHSAPKVSYEMQKIYLGKFDFDIGDSVGIKDEQQGIDDTVRVIEYSKDLVKNIYTSLKFSNVIEKIPYQFIREQYEQKKHLKKLSSAVSNSAQIAREALERHNLLVRNNFYGSENEYVLIGSEARNYALKGLTINPDDGVVGKVSWTDFEFQEILSNTPYQCGEGSVQLSEGTYYIFIQIQANDFANSSGQNKLVFSKTKLENSGSLIYYALGMAEFDGTRTKVGTSYGFTLIDGNFIKTGTFVANKITSGILQGSSGTTKFDLDNDIIDIGNGAIKIGKGVANGNDGIYINAGNLYVNGEIDTKYLKLTDSAIIDLDSYTTIATYSTYIEDKTAYTWHSVEYSTTNLLICETLVTAKGSKTYLKNVPIKLNIYVKVRATSGAYGASVKVYYKLYYDGTLIYTSQTTDWEYMTVIFDDYLDLYSLTTPSVGKTLKLKVYYMTASNADCNVESNLKAPKTLYIVHAI